MEAKYIAFSFAVREGLWRKKIYLFIELPSKIFWITIKEDIQKCVLLPQNNTVCDHSKHFDIKYQLSVENVRFGNVSVKYVSTNETAADAFTKPFSTETFQYFKKIIAME